MAGKGGFSSGMLDPTGYGTSVGKAPAAGKPPFGMPSYDTGFGAQRPKTPQEIANEQAQANVGSTQQDTRNNTANVQSEFIGSSQNLFRQGAYEDQALMALQQLGQKNQGAQQYEHESNMLKTQQASKMAMAEDAFRKAQGLMSGSAGLPGRESGGGAADSSAAEAAQFARAKDQIGQTGRGAVDSLRNLMAESGLSGGGYEQAGLANVLMGGQGQLGEVSRDMAIRGAERAGQVADRNYAGGIQQRGQDVAYNAQRQQALMALLQGLY